MKRGIRGLAGAALAGMLVVGCGNSSSSNSTSGNSSSSKPVGMTFAYDWPTPDFGMVPIAVAQKNGFYKAAGINLKVVFPPDVATTMKMVGIGQANIGYDTSTDVAFARQQSVPVVSIANFSQSNNWGLVGRPGETIDLHALKGKSIGIYTDSWTKAMLPFVLGSVGLTESDVKLIIAQNDVIPLLLAKKIDVATETSNYGAVEVKTTTGKAPTVVLAKSAGAPNVPIWGYVANQKWAAKHATLVKSWLSATKKGMQWSIAHPNQAVTIFEKMYPKNGSTHAYNLGGWTATIPLLKGPHGFFVENGAQWQQLTHALASAKVLNKVLSPSSYYTNTYNGG